MDEAVYGNNAKLRTAAFAKTSTLFALSRQWDQVFHWMLCEARRRDLPDNGFHGGIVMDEMTISEDLQAMRLVGFVDQGDESENLRKITKQSSDRELVNRVLLMQFAGFTGFRFPLHISQRGKPPQLICLSISRRWYQCCKRMDFTH